MSGIPNSQYLQCNEFGNWKKIVSDKYGFNNKSTETNYNILLAGDSFAHGVCVDQNYEIHNLLTENGSKSYSIGYNASGPLLTLATIIEISEVIKFDKIVWLFFRNDFYDVKWESKNLLLGKYLENNFEGYNYFEKNGFEVTGFDPENPVSKSIKKAESLISAILNVEYVLLSTPTKKTAIKRRMEKTYRGTAKL